MQILFKSGAKINGTKIRRNKDFFFLMAINRLIVTGIDRKQIVVTGHELVIKEFIKNNEITNYAVIE